MIAIFQVRPSFAFSALLALCGWMPLAHGTTTINEQFSPAVINQGDSSTYTITISNDSLVPLTAAKATVFLDNTVGAPNASGGRITIVSGTVLANTCNFTGVTATAGTSVLVLTNGTVPAGTLSTPATCNFSLAVTATTVGTFNAVIPATTTPSGSVSGYEALENSVPVQNGTPASVTLQVNALSAPTGNKTFAPSPAIAGDPTTLTITLTNPNAASTMPLTTFVDTFPDNGAGHAMVVANPAGASVSCTGTGASNGALTATPGNGSITLTGGTIGQAGACTIVVKVLVATIAGTSQVFSNALASGAIGNTRGLTSGAFSRLLTVNTPIAVTKGFGTTPIASGQATLMTITLTNNSLSNSLPITAFSDNLTGTGIKILNTSSLPVAAPANPAVVCNGAGASSGTVSFTPDTLNTTLSLAGTNIAGPKNGALGKCVVTAYATSNIDGSHLNTIAANAVSNTAGHASPGTSASFTTNAQLTLNKTVSVNQVAPGQWTQFTVTINNWSGAGVTNVFFRDDLPLAGADQMVLEGANPVTNAGCTGGTFAGADGASSLTWTGGTVPAGVGASPGVCTIVFKARLPATATTGAVFTNQVPASSATDATSCNGTAVGVCGLGSGPGGVVVNPAGSPAVNVTTVAAIALSKAFAAASIAQGGTSTLTLTLRNRVVAGAITAVNLTDNLPTGITLAANPAATNTCGGTLQAFPGSGSLVLTGGTVAARPSASLESTCAITVRVTGSAVGVYTNTVTPADVSTSAGTIPANVTATLTITTGITGTKSFTPASVTSGGTARVRISINNTSNGDLTNVSINDDDFATGTTGTLRVANPANASTSCSGSPTLVANPGAAQAQLLGATLVAGGNCDFSFDVVTTGAGPWSNRVGTGKVTSAEGSSNTAVISASMSAAAAAININKSFNPVIVTGGVPSVLTLTLSNTSAGTVRGIGFTDVFPTGIQVYSVPTVTSTCAGGTVTAIPGDGRISLAGATMAGGSTCQVSVQTTSVRFLNLTNTIPAGAVASTEGYTNGSAVSATLATLQGLGVMKSFSPAYVTASATTRLQIFLVSTFDPNAFTPLTLTGVSFTDPLPAGVVVAPVPNATTTCPGPGGAGAATITTSPGASLVTLSGAHIVPGSVCSVFVDVVAPATLGTYTNTIPANGITTDQGPTNSNLATADLAVVSMPTIAKTFLTPTISAGATSTLRVTITNGAGVPLTGVSLADTLPAGLAIAGTPTASTTCANGSVTANAGGGVLSISGATVPASGSCTFQANVVANTPGTYNNNINAGVLVSDQGLTNPGSASAALTVRSTPTVSKSFNPVSITAGGTSTLTLSLGNPNATAITLSSALVDALPGNVFVDATPAVVKTCAGTVTAAAGAATITYANGASIPAGGCTINVNVTSSIPGVHTNFIAAGQMTTSAGNNQDPAFADLAVGAGALVRPTVTKVFSPATIVTNAISTLTITLGNANASVLTLASAFTDNLPTNVVVAATPNVGGSCAGTVTAAGGGSTITYASGATIPAGGCTIAVDVTSATQGSYTDTIPAGALVTDGGSNLLAATAGLVVQAPLPPTFAKSFAPNTINLGGLSRLTLSLGNGNAASISLTADFTDTLPGGVTVAATPNVAKTCPGTVNAAGGGATITYVSPGAIPAGGCTIQVDVTAASNAGSPYTNTVAAGSLATDAGSNGATVTANLFVNAPQPPSLSKSFSPATIAIGGTSSLTLSLGNGNASGATLSADLVDSLPANVVVAAVPNIRTAGGCTLAKVVAAAGAASVTYQSGGVIPAGGCTVAVDVTSAVANSAPGYNNSIAANALVTTLGNNAISTSDRLYVLARPTVAKAFSPTSIASGSTSALTITLGNANATAITLTSALTDTLPSGVTVATPNGLGGTCTGAAVTATAGASTITYANAATIPAGGCTIVVNVTSSTGGAVTNTIAAGTLQTSAGSNAAAATATLTVLTAPTAAKSFSPSTIAAGATSALTITLGNTNAGAISLTAALTDTLPSGVTVATPNGLGGTCTGTVTATAGASTITYANASTIPAGGCTIVVNVTSSTSGAVTNTIAANALQTSAGGNASAATATLTVLDPPTVAKSFSPASIAAGGTSTLSITLGNTNVGAATLTAALTDTLPSGVTIATPNGLGGTCAGTVTATAGASTITYANAATIPAGGCTIVVNVTSSTGGTVTNTIAAGALQTSAGSNAAAATATLTVLGPPTVSKSFSPASIVAGGSSALTITLGNANAAAITLTSALTDTLPTGVTVATPNGLGGTCTGTVTATAGASSITLANGASIPSGGCTIVLNVTSSTGGVATNTIAAGALQTSAGSNAAAATATLTVLGPPTVAKNFSPSTIVVGATSALTITLGNANAGAVSLTSALTDSLPAGVTIAMPNGLGGTCAGTVTATAGASTITYANGASIPAGGCTIVVNVTSSTGGAVTNTIAASGLQTSAGSNAAAATATLTVLGPPTVAKSFLPASIAAAGTSALTITLGNSNAGAITLTSALTDTLPAGVTIATPNGLGGTCTGTVTATAGASTITYANGASVPAGGCTIVANVTSITVGTVTNTIAAGALQTSAGSNAAPASANLVVNALAAPDLTFAKAHAPANFGEGSNTAYYTLSPGNIGSVATSGTITIVDTLPAGITPFGTPAGTGWSCSVAGQTVTCTSTTSIAAGASGNPVTLRVAVAAGTNGLTLTNTAVISGGGEPAGFDGNNTATDIVTITAAASLGGRVWRDADHDRVLDAGETLVAGWKVELSLNGLVMATATTDAAGAYAFPALSPGTGYRVRFIEPASNAVYGHAVPNETGAAFVSGTTSAGNPAGASTTDGTLAGLTLVAGSNTTQQSLPLDPGGVVYDAVTRQPVAGATVGITGPPGFDPATHLVGGAANASQLTGSSGLYQFLLLPGAPAGTYTISVTPPGGYLTPPSGLIAPNAGPLNVPAAPGVTVIQSQGTAPAVGEATTYYFTFNTSGASQNVANNHIPLDPIGGISGRVFDDRDGGGTQGAGEPGIAGVTVTLRTAGGVTVATTTTDANGNYSFPNLVPGTYTVIETDPSGYTSTTANTVSVVVPAGGTGIVNFGDYVPPLGFVANAVCIRDTPYVDYTVTVPPGFSGAAGVSFNWIKSDGSSAQTLTGQPLSGRLLWPGASVDSNGNPTGWPGWQLVNGVWVQIADGLRPTMRLVATVNPTAEVTLGYPPATPLCAAEPPVAATASVSVIKTLYRGHSAGAGCPGTDELVVVDASRRPVDITWCVEVTNSGTAHLTNLLFDDARLAITNANQSALVLRSGTLPLAPGAKATWYFQDTRTTSLVNSVTVTGTPSTPAGVPTGQPPVQATDPAAVFAYVFDPPIGIKTGQLLAGQPVIRWTMAWINSAPVLASGVVITDSPPAGTTFRGGLVCTPRGTTTVSQCAFEAPGGTFPRGRVRVVADIGPDFGNDTEAAAANELLISFDVTIDDPLASRTYLNQGECAWDPAGTGSAPPCFTDDPATPGTGPTPVAVPASAANPVPTLSEWSLIMLSALLLLIGFAQMRQRETLNS